MTSLRFSVVEKAFQAKPQPVAVPDCRPSEYFGKYVFNREKMFKYLPSTVYARLVDAMDNGAPMDRDIADEVAAGMKRWASELGVTHYTHWFQPLTEGTAEKHDAFVEHASYWYSRNRMPLLFRTVVSVIPSRLVDIVPGTHLLRYL